MTTIDPRTPESGNAQVWPPQPYAYGSPVTYTTPPPPPVNKRRQFWLRGPGVMLIVVAVGLVLFGIAALGGGIYGAPAKPAFKVAVTSCDSNGSADLPNATVGFTVTNTGKATRSARVEIEYRDDAGNRIDTDSSWVRDIAPGDTARSTESTLLDAPPDGGLSCAITGIS
jgi:hypothetical protein